MQLNELKLNDKVIYELFEKDLIGRNKSVIKFINYLNAINTNCSIAIDGKWGSGKTIFVKECQMIINQLNDFIPSNEEIDNNKLKFNIRSNTKNHMELDIKPQIAIYYDAWENDDEDPILSLLYEICRTPYCDPSFFKPRNIIEIANEICKIVKGKDFSSLFQSLKGDDHLTSVKQSKGLKELINDFFDSLLPEQGERLVVFIDELDRCKPSFSVDFLEKIKHYFCNDKITFVFSINSEELQHTIKKYYGESFDGYKYLSKLFDLYIELPQADLTNYYRALKLQNASRSDHFIINSVFAKYNFQLREIRKFMILYNIIVCNKNIDRMFYSLEYAYNFAMIFIVPILIALKITDLSAYNDFIDGKNSGYFPEILEEYQLASRDLTVLLDANESYYDEENYIQVNRKEKAEKLYYAIFGKNNISYDGYNVGKVFVYDNTKKEVLEVVSLLADFSDIKIDEETE